MFFFEAILSNCQYTTTLILKPETSVINEKRVETDGKPVETSEKWMETGGKTHLEWDF